jgi:DNA-directed RNA polymerase subunit RPC12/RpoP
MSETIHSNGLENLIRYPVPCPSCGHKSLHIVRELITSDEVACTYCNAIIDLTDNDWRAGLQEFADGLSELFVIKRPTR